jgi:F-type H+-transporting ATPase subunit b
MKTLRTLLSLAITPLCVAFLLAEPSSLAGRGAQDAGEAAEHENAGAEAAEHEGGEHHVSNPIQNLFDFGYRGKNAEGGEWHEGEHKMPPPFSMQLLNFAVFAVLMFRAAGPSIRKMTQDRHDAIAKALAEGTRLRDEAKAKLAEYDKKLASLQGEIDALVGGIRAEAEAEKKRIVAEAEARAERMTKDAEQQIQAEMARVRVTLEREAVVAAVSIAEKLLTEKSTEADQRLLADRFVKGLAETSTKGRRAGA